MSMYYILAVYNLHKLETAAIAKVQTLTTSGHVEAFYANKPTLITTVAMVLPHVDHSVARKQMKNNTVVSSNSCRRVHLRLT